MGGVNKCDQFLSYYSTGYKSMKWWKCIFYCLLELRIANALVIYFHKNPEVKKKKETISQTLSWDVSTWNCATIDKCTDGTYTAPGRRTMQHEKWSQTKHFPVSRHPMGKFYVGCAYKKKPNGKYRQCSS